MKKPIQVAGRWDNAEEDRVELVPYDPGWPEQFQVEAQTIRDVLGHVREVTIEHFGSTAVPGLASKPIIDIFIGADKPHWPAVVSALTQLGYIHWEENPESDREFLVKGMPPYGDRRTHHVHVGEVGSALWQRLLFRDYLRAHPDEVVHYQAVKAQLAARHATDREAYTQGKSQIVEEFMARARTWRRG